MKSRSLSRRIVLLLATALLLAIAVPASAGVPSGEPYNCVTTAWKGWGDNCWVSNNSADPDRISDLTTGVQTIVSYEAWLGSIDGYYGTNSYNATKVYQAANGLTADGIVGENTWEALRTELVFDYSSSGLRYFAYNTAANPSYFRTQNEYTSYWQVESPRAQSWVWMDRTRS